MDSEVWGKGINDSLQGGHSDASFTACSDTPSLEMPNFFSWQNPQHSLIEFGQICSQVSRDTHL